MLPTSTIISRYEHMIPFSTGRKMRDVYEELKALLGRETVI